MTLIYYSYKKYDQNEKAVQVGNRETPTRILYQAKGFFNNSKKYNQVVSFNFLGIFYTI